MEVGKPRTKKHWGLLFLAGLALLILVGIRVGIALADTGGEEVRIVGSDVDRVLVLSPASPLPTPSPAAVVTPTPSLTPTAAVRQEGEAPSLRPTPSPTPSPTPVVTPTPELQTMQVALTFYTCPPFCLGDPMANTEPLHEGAAACGYALKMGQRFEFDGEEYRCEDRGG
ncbi:hypothetical protein LCGC14_2225810, partial [marine sediment metagenome]